MPNGNMIHVVYMQRSHLQRTLGHCNSHQRALPDPMYTVTLAQRYSKRYSKLHTKQYSKQYRQAGTASHP